MDEFNDRDQERLEKEYNGFHIDSEEKAEWVLRKITEIDASAERVKANAEALLRSYENHRKWLLWRFGKELEDFCRKRLEADPTRKSVRLLHGTLAFRKNPGRLRLVDTDAALAYLDNNDELFERVVEVVPKIRAQEYIKTAEETGEMLPGLEYVPEQECFYICGHRVDPGASE